MYVGVNFTPSIIIAAGAKSINDIIVIIENRVMLSKESCQHNGKSISVKTWNATIYELARPKWNKIDAYYYLFLKHNLLAKDITGLESQIGSHCTQKSSPSK